MFRTIIINHSVKLDIFWLLKTTINTSLKVLVEIAQRLAVGKIQIGPDRTGSARIGSVRIDETRTGSITPDNVLKFCAFLSCVVVSSFIETRRNVFFSRGDYRFRSGIMKDTM